MTWSAIIPSNDAMKLQKCIQAIVEHQPDLGRGKIIVVDDGALAGWPGAVDFDPEIIKWVPGAQPFVYARNINLGIAAAPPEDDLLILGDDVRLLTPFGFDFLAESAQRKGVAAVSPGIIGLVGNRDQNRHTNGAVRESARALCFVCIYVKRQVANAVGALDEQFVHYGGEDIDYCWRIKDWAAREKANGALPLARFLVDDRCAVMHNDTDMPSAFRTKPDIIELSGKALELLRAKWPAKFQEATT